MRKLTLALLCLVQAIAQLLTPSVAASLLAAKRAQAEGDAAPAVVINEIHYDPALKSADVEYVELYNAGANPVNLTGWSLGSGIDYVFTPGMQLPPAAYLVVGRNPAALRQVYGTAAGGPFAGRLANEGDKLTLRDRAGQVVDEVEYAMGFPWPTPHDDGDQSISLINALLDNGAAGAWRSTPPTPGRQNSALVENPAPFVHAVSHAPTAPRAADTVTISARVTDADGVAGVRLLLQPVAPGQYIRLQDPQYQANWVAVPMQPAGGDVYVAQTPADMRVNRMLVRYRVEVTDTGGRSVLTPYADDPQPNFAYFVYDGPPPWQGAIKPQALGPVNRWETYDFNQMRPLPVYNLLAQQADVEDAQYIPNSRLPHGYTGNDYPWRGTLVVNGAVYDHIGFRARGGEYRYMAGKNHWKFDFTRGHAFQAYDDYGKPYAVKWDKLNFSAVLQHAQRKFRGEQGMFESLAYRMFNLAGVPASHTHFVHFRVVDQWEQATSSQYSGDFWGLYLAIENMDGRFLEEHDLPDGNLYDMINWTGELDNQGDRAVTDRSDLDQFMATYTWGNPDAAWWRRSFDLNGYYRFRSVLEAVHHYDVHQGKNYYYYLNPDTGKWSILPWDLDLTWSETMFGLGAEPFRDRVLPIGEFNVAYQNNLRELRDLLFNPEQMYPLIDETAALIDTPAAGFSMVDADRAMWDYSPILSSPYVSDDRAVNGRFYESAPNRTFAGMVQLIREYVARRTGWIDQALLTDKAFPDTPSLHYAGPAGFPADQLVMRAGGFRDPQGADTFAAMQWRSAEIVRPGLPGYIENSRWRYEIEHTWLSPIITGYQSDMAVPNGACRPGVLCRVRVRMMDTSGRWSHWSAPVEFIAGSPTLGPPRDLKISEIMYKPAVQDTLPSQELEFLEFTNTGATPIDLSNMRFSEGIDYTFPSGASLSPGAFVVLANHARYFEQYYGYAPFGQYDRELSNQGERIVLLDAFGNPVVNVAYGDDGPWPEAADGLGPSLVAIGGDPNNPAAWRASTAVGGSPGAPDPLPVVINEVLTDPRTGAVTKVELYNPSAVPADVGAWQLTTAAPVVRGVRGAQVIPQSMQFAPRTTVPPDGYTVVDVVNGLPLGNGDKVLTLLSTSAGGRLSGYIHRAVLSLPLTATSIGRLVTTDGREHFVAQQTPTWGGPNAGPQPTALAISALSANPTDGVQWLELTNTGSVTASLYNPDSMLPGLLFAGVAYQVPAGVELSPGGRAIVAAGDPSALCLSGRVPPGLRVLGPLALPLGGQGMDLRLLQQAPWGGGWSFAEVDRVEYRSQAPWPSQGAGVVLARNDLQGFGAEPANWRAVTLTGAGGLAGMPPGVLPLGAAADVCSFDAFVNARGNLEVRWVARPLRDTVSFRLLRSPIDEPAAKVVLATEPAAEVEEQSGPAHTQFVDAQADPSRTYVYWLQAVAADNTARDVAVTGVRTRVTLFFAPYIAP